LLCLREERTVAAPRSAAQEALLNTDLDLDSVTPIAPAGLATALKNTGVGDQVVRADANQHSGRWRA
jgi:hypothetical protein